MDASDQAAAAKKAAHLRSLVLSDLLRGELRGKPVDWARYHADFRKKASAFTGLNHQRLICPLPDNKWVVTFSGLILLKTKDARALIRDCRSVYNVLRQHYKKHLGAKISVRDIGKAAKLKDQRAALAVSMLCRESDVGMGGGNVILTPTSEVNGNQPFLDMSFTARLRKRYAQLTRPHVDSPPTNLPLVHFGPRSGNRDQPFLFEQIGRLGNSHVKTAWNKCLERLEKDPDGAVTSARSLLESVCKQVLEDRAVRFSERAGLNELWADVRNVLSWDPRSTANKTLREVLQSCGSIVVNLGVLRNEFGDSHGKAPDGPKASPRHARLTVGLAGSMAEFILTTADGRALP